MILRFNGYEITEIARFIDIYNAKNTWENLFNPSIYTLTSTYDWFYSTWKSLSGIKDVRAISIKKKENIFQFYR